MNILNMAFLSLSSAIGKEVNRAMKKYERLFQVLVMAFVLWTIATPAWAAIGFLTDVTTLVQAISTWLLIIIPVTGGVMLAYYAIMKMMNEGDPSVAAHSNRAMKNVIIAAVIGMAAMGLISGITGYFADQTTSSMIMTHLTYLA
jgi:drug/metabolite transporter (DMT)-like permease